VSVPGVKCAIEQPRVHGSVHHEVSTYSAGFAARAPKRAASFSSTALRRTSASSAATRSAFGPNENATMIPGPPDGLLASIVSSTGDPGSAVWPL
jgi:hypothetical protein